MAQTYKETESKQTDWIGLGADAVKIFLDVKLVLRLIWEKREEVSVMPGIAQYSSLSVSHHTGPLRNNSQHTDKILGGEKKLHLGKLSQNKSASVGTL